MRPILISGVQPTGKLHIGNYLGALKNFVDLQNSDKYQCYFFIADLHALTENPSAADLSENIINLVADFLAVGLNPDKSVIFQQSQILEHSELAWVLNTITPMGELFRMTQFKDKGKRAREILVNYTVDEIGEEAKKRAASERRKLSHCFEEVEEENKDRTKDKIEEVKNILEYGVANAGLFDYPVLMAADILLYNAQFVPVGEDQLQHLELARRLARKFNRMFGEIFVKPQAILTKAPRVMSLDNPNKKMSKTLPKGCLYLADSPKIIKAKIKAAVTDSGRKIEYDPEHRSEISNLVLIYSEFSGESIAEVVRRFKGVNYTDFKKELAEVIIKTLRPFQEKRAKLIKNPKQVMKILTDGAKKTRPIAEATMKEIRRKTGLI